MERNEIGDLKHPEDQDVFQQRKQRSAAEVLGLILFTLILGIPLFSVAFAIIVTFIALSASTAAVGIAGVVFAAMYPFMGAASETIFAGIGMGFAASGIGLMLFGAFVSITRLVIIGFSKLFKAIYVRR